MGCGEILGSSSVDLRGTSHRVNRAGVKVTSHFWIPLVLKVRQFAHKYSRRGTQLS
jgi:hypothetical protein